MAVSTLRHTGTDKGWGIFATRDISASMRDIWRLDHMLHKDSKRFARQIDAIFEKYPRLPYGETVTGRELRMVDLRYVWTDHHGREHAVSRERIAAHARPWGFYANHDSDDPTHVIYVDAAGRAWLLPVRDVRRGEEITIDYGAEYWVGRPAPVTTRLVLEGGVVTRVAEEADDDETEPEPEEADEESEVLMICFYITHMYAQEADEEPEEPEEPEEAEDEAEVL